MQAEVRERDDALVVYLEQADGAQAIDRLMVALGAEGGGTFVPRFPPESDKYHWARYYKCADSARRATAIELLQRAFTQPDDSLTAWGVVPDGGTLRITPPPARRQQLGGAYKRLGQLSIGLTTLLTQQQRQQGEFRLGNKELARWVARMLVSLVAAPDQSASPGGAASQAAPDSRVWLEILAAYCQQHRPHGIGVVRADLTPVRDAIWRGEWEVAVEHVHGVRRSGQVYDRAELDPLRLQIAAGQGDYGAAAEIIDGLSATALDDTPTLRAAVATWFHLGRDEAAEEALDGRLAETPESDADALRWLLAARLDLRRGRSLAALGRVLAARPTGAALGEERAALLADAVDAVAAARTRGDVAEEELGLALRAARDDDRAYLASLQGSETEVIAIPIVPDPPPAMLRDPAAIFDEAIREADPATAREKIRALLDSDGDDPAAPRWLLKLGNLDRRRGSEDLALAAYDRFFAYAPDLVGANIANQDIVDALRFVLTRRPVSDPGGATGRWLAAIHQGVADATLLLLWAEAEVGRDRARAAALVGRAFPDLAQFPGPRAADQARNGLALHDERLLTLCSRLFDGLAEHRDHDRARHVIAELWARVGTLDPKPLGYLFDQDMVEGEAQRIVDRLTRIEAALDTLVPAPGATGPRKDALARLAVALETAGSTLLGATDTANSVDELTASVVLAMDAALAAGDQARARQLLNEALGGTSRNRLTPANVVDLADALASAEQSLTAEARGLVIRGYESAATSLLNQLPGGDPFLLDLAIRALGRFDEARADRLRQFRDEYLAAQADGSAPSLTERSFPLAGLRLAIAGGDASTRRRAIEDLREYGALDVAEVPPAYEANLSEPEIGERLRGTVLVIEVWRQTKHSTSHGVKAAIDRLKPSPNLVHAAGTGRSSIVRAALNWAAEQHEARG